MRRKGRGVRESGDAHKCAKHSAQVVRVSTADVDQTRCHQAYEGTRGEAECQCEDNQSGKRVMCIDRQPDHEDGDGGQVGHDCHSRKVAHFIGEI